MGLFIILGSLLIFGNVSNPDIETNEVQIEVSHYQFEERIKLNRNGKELGSFTPNGVQGIGMNINTIHKNNKNWLGTLNVRYYRATEYRMAMYSAGLDYVRIRPKSSARLSVGAEVGQAELKIDRFSSHGRIRDTIGWEVHSAFKSHFVAFDELWSYYVRPSMRSYKFQFDGKNGLQDELIDGEGFAIAAGLGFRF